MYRWPGAPIVQMREGPVREAVVVEAVRSPFGKRNGSLADTHPVDLSAEILNALITRARVEPDLIDDVLWGCVSQIGDQSSNIGRFAVLAAGWPDSIPGVTINRACGSSQQSLDFAAMGIMSGQYDVVVAGGVEVMSRVPLGSAREIGMPYGPRVMKRYDDFSFNQGISAEMMSTKWGFSQRISTSSHHFRTSGPLARLTRELSNPRFTPSKSSQERFR